MFTFLTKKKKKEKNVNVKELAIAAKKVLAFALKVARWHTIILFITVIILAIVPFVNIWISSLVVDELVRAVSENSVSTEAFYKYVLLFVIVGVFRRILSVIRTYTDQNMWFAFSREFDYMVTRKFSTLDMEYYDNPETRTLIQKVIENYGHRPLNFIDRLVRIIRPTVTILSSFYLLFVFSPLLVLLLFLSVIPEASINIIFGKRKWGVWDMKGEKRRDYHSTRYHLQAEHSLMEVRIFGIRSYFLERVYKLFRDFQDEQIKIDNTRLKVTFFSRMLHLAGYSFAYIKFGLAVFARTITIGQLNFYLSLSGRLQDAFDNLFFHLTSIYEHGLYVHDIFTFLELKDKIEPGTKKLKNIDKPPLIELKNVSFKYPGTDTYVLKNFSLTIKPGDHLAIVGENGAGKSTLIKLLMRFYDVTKGEILIEGINIKELDIDSWYKYVGTLFQDFNIYHFDAKTSIGLGDISKFKDQKKIEAAAKKSGAHSFITKYKKGYKQILNKSFEGGINPSDGQRQRIALARVFFKDPKVLILDEPTSAIDPKAEYEIFEDLYETARGKTVVTISHRFSTVKNAKRIIVLEDGKIIEDGSHEELLKIEDGKYKIAFELQKKGYE
jgi:ATP-binding cassette subfamily B protein